MGTATKLKPKRAIKLTKQQRSFLAKFVNGRYSLPRGQYPDFVLDMVKKGALSYEGVWEFCHHWEIVPHRMVLEFQGETNDLKRRRPRAKMEGPTKPSTEPDVAKKRGAIKNPDTPLGQTAAFMRHRMGRLDLTVQDFADELTKAGWDGTYHAVRKWITGANGPTLGDLMYVAKALGYADWVAFVADVGKFHRKK